MNEAMKKIEEALRRDPKQLEKLDMETARIIKEEAGIAPAEAYVRAIKTVLGIGVSLSDLERAKAAAEELDPDELTAGTGGWGNNGDDELEMCMADYACFAILMHDTKSDNHNEACWRDYLCGFVYHEGIFQCTAADNNF